MNLETGSGKPLNSLGVSLLRSGLPSLYRLRGERSRLATAAGAKEVFGFGWGAFYRARGE